MVIKFISVNAEARTATFDVDGSEVTRPIAEHVTDSDLADHIQALANGLAVEFEENTALTKTDPFEVGYEFEIE